MASTTQAGTPPKQVHSQAGTPPGRYTQPRVGTPPWQVQSPGQVHQPRAGTPPPHPMVNARAVRILPECSLVYVFLYLFGLHILLNFKTSLNCFTSSQTMLKIPCDGQCATSLKLLRLYPPLFHVETMTRLGPGNKSKGTIPSGGSRTSPRRGRQLSRGSPTYDFANFFVKPHEIERIRTPGGGGASKILLCRSATDTCLFVEILVYKEGTY